MKKQQPVSENESRLLKMAAELGITFIDLKRDFAFKWTFGTQGVNKNSRVIRHFSIREDEDGMRICR